jgi:hypothetical protein
MSWIKCSDRLPEAIPHEDFGSIDPRVIVWNEWGHAIARYDHEAQWWFEEGYTEPLFGVTHWQPLPESPHE